MRVNMTAFTQLSKGWGKCGNWHEYLLSLAQPRLWDFGEFGVAASGNLNMTTIFWDIANTGCQRMIWKWISLRWFWLRIGYVASGRVKARVFSVFTQFYTIVDPTSIVSNHSQMLPVWRFNFSNITTVSLHLDPNAVIHSARILASWTTELLVHNTQLVHCTRNHMASEPKFHRAIDTVNTIVRSLVTLRYCSRKHRRACQCHIVHQRRLTVLLRFSVMNYWMISF